MKNKDQRILENRSSLVSSKGDEVFCEDCGELLVFGMQDKQHTFSLGLSSVLECLSIAERDGFVPKLPDEWWVQVCSQSSKISKNYWHINNREK